MDRLSESADRPWIGPVLTGAVVVLLVLARSVIPVTNPGVLLLLTVAVAAVSGGIAPALVSAAIMVGFTIVDASDPGHLFSYSAVNFSRLALSIAVAPTAALVVGALAHRLERESHRSEARRMETAQAEGRQRAITEPSPDAILSVDEAGRIDSANPAALRMFGYTAEELVGSPIARVAADDGRGALVDRVRRSSEAGDGAVFAGPSELAFRDAGGRSFPAEVSIGEFGVEGERRFMWSIRDVSARKSLEVQLLQAQRMEAIGQLAGGVAHDFNNLLTAMIGYTDLLGDELGAGDPRQETVGEIRAAADRAASLTRQLLAFSRRQTLQPAVINLSDVVRRLEPILRRLLGEHIRLDLRPAAQLHTVLADPAQMEAVLMNLALNARDAMPAGGTLRIETANVELDAAYAFDHAEVVPGQYVLLSASDTGTGMDARTQAHIFEPFFTTKEVGKGTGLGLATVYGIVRQSGGHVCVESEPDHGSAFKVYMPVKSGPTAALQPADQPRPRTRGSEQILVVEDEEVVRTLVVAILGRHGYRVTTAVDVVDAIDVLSRPEIPIDLLISDVVMPLMGGPALVARARELRPEIRALMISGYAMSAIGPEGLAKGDHFLQKPFTPPQLAEAVRVTLDEERPAAPRSAGSALVGAPG